MLEMVGGFLTLCTLLLVLFWCRKTGLGGTYRGSEDGHDLFQGVDECDTSFMSPEDSTFCVLYTEPLHRGVNQAATETDACGKYFERRKDMLRS